MNCEEMMRIPELEYVLKLQSGETGFILQTACNVSKVNIK